MLLTNRLPELSISELDLRGKDKNYKVAMSLCYSPSITDYSETVKYLHPEELDYYMKLTYERRARSYLAGRYAAKRAISSFIQEEHLNKIIIERGVFHQPIVVYPHKKNIQVSITHCENIGAAIAFPETIPMGIDIERVSIKRKDILKSKMTDQEKKLIKSLTYPEEFTLTLLWSAKESLSKILKTGLTLPLDILAICKLEIKENAVLGYFENFPQYCVTSLIFHQHVCSITYPKGTLLDLKAIKGTVEKIKRIINT
ncbi:4'-phosphopantetheinyl transferase superfamily protein [Priestia aryabhattai]|uniref:4'-phosphopantetheinyl transferase family protein n=1 Tax=Priestia aryabhattai TaxID=412384 RepID=UPI0028819C30|nr:4'-phosphopantetheinyl transferase superfamily protein [Priestia aryabhattai]MDT0150202.1 4'-phosphopantetheinyl transferase superfamily protein [Priestia aryabhattai]MDT0155770.1 4'-phosphopantetheinyl transferase superfamily protein [Priestia aryabhattai]